MSVLTCTRKQGRVSQKKSLHTGGLSRKKRRSSHTGRRNSFGREERSNRGGRDELGAKGSPKKKIRQVAYPSWRKVVKNIGCSDKLRVEPSTTLLASKPLLRSRA